MLLSPKYTELNPRNKDSKWINDLISEFRLTGLNAIYSREKAQLNRRLINSDSSIENIKKMFENPNEMEKAGFEFMQIAVIEKIKNIITAERMKAEIKAYVDAQDPSLERLKKEDKELLKNKKTIDFAVNTLKQKIGLPLKNIDNEDFSGNYNSFDEMGFDSDDIGDIETFFQVFYQLDTEIDFQKIINHVFALNSIDEYTYRFVEDVLSTKTLAIQQYVNKLTGQINIKRIIPENLRRIVGENGVNQKSDIAVGYYEIITIQEFLKRVGDNFDFVQEFASILAGVNSYNNVKYGAIELSEGVILGDRNTQICTYTNLLSYKVEVGYIEFKSIDSIDYKRFVNSVGNEKVYQINDNKKDKKQYSKEPLFMERTYKANFMTTSISTQYVFNSGLLYHQETEGQEDEYSNFSIKYIHYEGKTVAEIAKPWVTMAQEAFNKFRFLLRNAKPDGTDYNIESLMQVSKAFLGTDGKPEDLQAVLKLLQKNADSLWSFPEVNGQIIQTQGDLNRPIKSPFDNKMKTYKDIVDWAVAGIKSDLGFNDMRSGETPSTNDVYKLEQASLVQSSNATYYIDSMFDYIYKNAAISTLAFVNDIIRFKDTLPYNYILNVIGESGIKRLETLPRISPHRMDIYVSSFGTVQDRIRILQDTSVAFQKGIIDYSTKILIDSINDHRQAQKLLIIKQDKAKKQAQQQAQQAQQYKMQEIQAKTQGEKEIVQLRGDLEIKKAQIQAEGYITAATINSQSGQERVKAKGEVEKEGALLEHQLKQQDAFGVE